MRMKDIIKTIKKKLKIGRPECIDELGELGYGFLADKEILIYKFLCEEEMTSKEMNFLKKEEKFFLYRDWECYVRNRYERFSTEKLREFIRYLENRKRLAKSKDIHWNVASVIFITYFLSKGLDLIIGDAVIIEFAVFIISFIVYINTSFINGVIKNGREIKFYDDYIEIIDKMLYERK